MDNNLSLPEVDDPQLAEKLGELGGPVSERRGWLFASVLWVRLVALCLGLAGLFGGVGAAFAMSRVSLENMDEFWMLGLIPAFVGVGLLIFYAMSKHFSVLALEDSRASCGGE